MNASKTRINRLGRWLLALAIMTLAACASSPEGPETITVQSDDGTPTARAVGAYVDAFNARDMDALSALMHEDIEWLSIDGSDIVTVSSGRDALSQEMQAYFASGTDVRSSLSGVSSTGPYVSTIETAHWTNSDGEAKSQSSLAVYEITERGLIRRVWYFPEVSGGH